MPQSKSLRSVVVSDRKEVRAAVVKLGLAARYTRRLPTDVAADKVRGAIVVGDVIPPWLAVNAAQVIEVDFGYSRPDDTRSAAELVRDCRGCGAYRVEEVPYTDPATQIVNCDAAMVWYLRHEKLVVPNARVAPSRRKAGELTDKIVAGPVPLRDLLFARYAVLPRFDEASVRADLERRRSRGDISPAERGQVFVRHFEEVVSYRVRLTLESGEIAVQSESN